MGTVVTYGTPGVSVGLVISVGVVIGASMSVLVIARLKRTKSLPSILLASLCSAIILMGALTHIFSASLVTLSSLNIILGSTGGIIWTQNSWKENDRSMRVTESTYSTSWRSGMNPPKISGMGMLVSAGLIAVTGQGLVSGAAWLCLGFFLSRILPYISGEVTGRLLEPMESVTMTRERFGIYQGTLALPFVILPYLARGYYLFTYPPRSVELSRGALMGFALVFTTGYTMVLFYRNIGYLKAGVLKGADLLVRVARIIYRYLKRYILLRP